MPKIHTMQDNLKTIVSDNKTSRLTVVLDNILVSALYKMNINTQRVLLFSIAQINSKEDIDSYKQKNASYYTKYNIKNSIRVTLCSNAFAKAFDINKKNCYRLLKAGIENLKNTQLTPKIENNIIDVGSWYQFLISGTYEDNQGYASVIFNPQITPLISNISNSFTSCRLSDFTKFNSIYSTKIYHNCMRFQNTGRWRISISELRELLNLENRYPSYPEFNRSILKKAKIEINSNDLPIKIQIFKISAPGCHSSLEFKIAKNIKS